jgi:hypothetical protein
MPSLPKPKRPSYREKARRRTSDSAYNIHKLYRWKKLSRKARSSSWCLVCEKEGVIAPAEDLDHAIRLQEGGAPWDSRNFLPLCKYHHGKKTNMEVNGYKPPSIPGEGGLIPESLEEIVEDVYKSSSSLES